MQWLCTVKFKLRSLTLCCSLRRRDSVGAVDIRRPAVRVGGGARRARAVGEGRATATAAQLYHRRLHADDQVLDAGRGEQTDVQGVGRGVRKDGERSWPIPGDTRRPLHAASLVLFTGTSVDISYFTNNLTRLPS